MSTSSRLRSRSFGFLGSVLLGGLLATGCGSGGGGDSPPVVSLFLQNSIDADAVGGPDGGVFNGGGGGLNLTAVFYQRIDVLGPVVGVPIPGGLLTANGTATDAMFVANLIPGVYDVAVEYSGIGEMDQALYAADPFPTLFTALSVPLAPSYGDPSIDIDLTAYGGVSVTLVVQSPP